MYKKVDMEILREFIEGEVHDIYSFVKKYCYKDMYMTIHDYYLSRLSNNDSLEQFIKIALKDYKLQNKLNKALKITDGKYFDEYLINCIIGSVYEKFPNSEVLQKETKESFFQKLLIQEQCSLDNKLISEHDISLLTGLLRHKFENKNNPNIEAIIDFIKELSKEEPKKIEQDFDAYFNELISLKNYTLNQLGKDSLINKGIYELSLGKVPTKNQLIMLTITLKLNKNEQDTLFTLARNKIKDTSYSNMYAFEKDNNRDNLILHWLNNLERLQEIAKVRNKNVVQILNDILKESNFDILK